jgi:hypothetical protein
VNVNERNFEFENLKKHTLGRTTPKINTEMKEKMKKGLKKEKKEGGEYDKKDSEINGFLSNANNDLIKMINITDINTYKSKTSTDASKKPNVDHKKENFDCLILDKFEDEEINENHGVYEGKDEYQKDTEV